MIFMAKHEFERLLKDFGDIQKAQGEHNGRWEDELNHEWCSEEYLETMKRFADEYGIKYLDNLEDNFDPEEWEEEGYEDTPEYAQDELGCELMYSVTKKILDEIFEYIKFDKNHPSIKAI